MSQRTSVPQRGVVAALLLLMVLGTTGIQALCHPHGGPDHGHHHVHEHQQLGHRYLAVLHLAGPGADRLHCPADGPSGHPDARSGAASAAHPETPSDHQAPSAGNVAGPGRSVAPAPPSCCAEIPILVAAGAPPATDLVSPAVVDPAPATPPDGTGRYGQPAGTAPPPALGLRLAQLSVSRR
ncbi:hypothetical protein [Micromonospora echinofusca]|uniref:Secreted protein n=1 Tax=Micromonospora echinofusca TaxID=47858 RepID=A0ABS3VRJ8_MICEH|nr:hypothetical protein [Micromonospora echinofusca]MBO4207164.1 hypothetical protein [Micromonospora echinofusca]